MIDLLEGKPTEIKIGEHGVVKLLDCMPRLVEPGKTFDNAVIEAARVSYGGEPSKADPVKDRGLIRYLMRHNHRSPFEMVDIKFYMSLPIFVARQLIRHRTASINEYSMRYKAPRDRFFIPQVQNVRKQAKNNKQGSIGVVELDTALKFIEHTERTATLLKSQYDSFEKAGVGREIARINLPLGTFTEWYWEIDLHNLLHFLGLRIEAHAQKEIQDYAQAIYDLIKPLAPFTVEAFEHFNLNSISLSALEVQAIKNGTGIDQKATDGEKAEFEEKKKALGLGI